MPRTHLCRTMTPTDGATATTPIDATVITTAQYTLSASVLVRTVMRRMALRWWWTVTLPVAVLFSLGVAVDAAYAVTALMVIFIVVPTLLMIAYFNVMLRPEAIRTVMRQHAVISWPDLTVTYSPQPVTDPDTGESRTPATPAPRHIDITKCRATFLSRGHMVIEVTTTDYVIIPASSMTPDEWYLLLGRSIAQ